MTSCDLLSVLLQCHMTSCAHIGKDSLRKRVERSSLPSQKVGTARNGIKNVSRVYVKVGPCGDVF